MRPVAVVSFAQARHVRREEARNEVEMLLPVVAEAVERSGIARREIGFTISGSSDFLSGVPFSFVSALDAVGAWPPIEESHLEMDGAFALYEAWVRLQHGDVDSALVYAFGKSSAGSLRDVLVQQLDPYYVSPLGPEPIALAALQARALLDGGRHTQRDFAGVAARSRRDARENPAAQIANDISAERLLDEPYVVEPLRRHDCPPISDGAAAVVLVAGDLATKVCARPAWITGIDHRIEPHALGARDLARSRSTEIAADKAGVGRGAIDVAELHAPFSHQELILRDALGLGEGTRINPSGGALAANAVMVAGLVRIGEAARRILDGSAGRVLGHATSGPCLQQNLVCVMEAAR